MSNHSLSNVSSGVDIGYEYSTYILGTLFFASEVLPLLKGKVSPIILSEITFIASLENFLFNKCCSFFFIKWP